MKRSIEFSGKAKQDIDFHKKSGNKILLQKINLLILEIVETPFTGSGKPEALKYELTGKWSRRINEAHRLVYSVTDSVIYIHSACGHYSDK